MRILALSLLISLLFMGCGAKKEEKPVAPQKENPTSGDLVSEVEKENSYPEAGLRTLRGAKDVKKQKEKDQEEANQILDETD